MKKTLTIVICGLAIMAMVVAKPFQKVKRQEVVPTDVESIVDKLGRPNHSAAIRNNIVDTFSCEGKVYGYYADIDNDCQLFHICYPVTLADGTKQTFKWSFICPQESIFDQETLTCTLPADATPCT